MEFFRTSEHSFDIRGTHGQITIPHISFQSNGHAGSYNLLQTHQVDTDPSNLQPMSNLVYQDLRIHLS